MSEVLQRMSEIHVRTRLLCFIFFVVMMFSYFFTLVLRLGTIWLLLEISFRLSILYKLLWF